jgi:hypothetical protein
VACELPTLSPSPGLPALGSPDSGVRVPSLSKRGVVAFRKRLLRSVVYECGQSPKDVLSGSFKNIRRAASTKMSKRMSRRFARTSRHGPLAGPVDGAASEVWAWRSVGDVVREVLHDAAIPTGTAPNDRMR